jgi:hypothetical protein
VRKTAGNAIELTSFLAVGWSPLWLLAAAADLTGGTRVYLRALLAELRGAGVLPAESTIASVEELLTTLERSSGLMADTIDMPPTISARRDRHLFSVWHCSVPIGACPAIGTAWARCAGAERPMF